MKNIIEYFMYIAVYLAGSLALMLNMENISGNNSKPLWKTYAVIIVALIALCFSVNPIMDLIMG